MAAKQKSTKIPIKAEAKPAQEMPQAKPAQDLAKPQGTAQKPTTTQ